MVRRRGRAMGRERRNEGWIDSSWRRSKATDSGYLERGERRRSRDQGPALMSEGLMQGGHKVNDAFFFNNRSDARRSPEGSNTI